MTSLQIICAAICATTMLVGQPRSATAQSHPYRSSPVDEWTLDRMADDWYRVTYYNSDPPSSFGSPRHLTMGDMRVGLDLEMTSGPEYLTVTPPDGWIAVPPVIEVEDGETGTVDVIRVVDWMGM